MDHGRGMIGILRRVKGRRCTLLGLVAVVASATALAACGDAEDAATGSGARANVAAIEPLPTRNPRAKAVEPVAGESAEFAGLPSEEASSEPTPTPSS